MADDTPTLSALAARAQVLTTPCGAGEMVWRAWGAGDKTVVLLHGGSGSWRHWVKTIPALAARCRVLAADLPGLGDSAMPPDPPVPASSAEVVAAGLRSLVTAGSETHLVGFSYGSHVATLAAPALDRHIADLTIVGCAALGLPPWPMDEFPKERAGMTDTERRAVHRRTLEILMFADPAAIDDLAVDIQAANVARTRLRTRHFAGTDDIARGLADVRVPLKSIWGARDILAHPSFEAVRKILAQHHPELDFRTVPGAGHWVMYERGDDFATELIDVIGL
jgi:pimeloyl-ACP methyl ester carboxylesterase